MSSSPSSTPGNTSTTSASGVPLVVRFLAVMLAVALGTGISIGYAAWTTAGDALEAAHREQLTTARAIKARLLETYFRNIRHEVDVLSMLPETSDAIMQFSEVLASLDVSASDDAREQVVGFVNDVFMTNYEQETGRRLPSASVTSDRPASLVVQAAYLVNNPNPLGSKHLLDDSRLVPEYDGPHFQYHPLFRELLEIFGYYDIFLIDASGEIVYSVYKEIDFGTNLLTGPFKDSGLADAVRSSLESTSTNAVSFADFSTYTPSYESPAAFVAKAVHDGDEVLGVVAIQLPIDEIDEVMTGGRRWAEEGFGESGEAYLVGPDLFMRSDARTLIEDPDAFIRNGRSRGIAESTLKEMARLERTVLLERVENEAVSRALDGESGDAEVTSYHGEAVVASFQPVSVFDRNWALIAEIGRAEAYAGADAMRASDPEHRPGDLRGRGSWRASCSAAGSRPPFSGCRRRCRGCRRAISRPPCRPVGDGNSTRWPIAYNLVAASLGSEGPDGGGDGAEGRTDRRDRGHDGDPGLELHPDHGRGHRDHGGQPGDREDRGGAHRHHERGGRHRLGERDPGCERTRVDPPHRSR